MRSWQTDEGLPQNSVWSLAQTPDGYLWVGTHEGLARFDGVRFALVDEPSAPYLKHAWIVALCLTRDGSLWIACENNGLTRLKDGDFSQFKEADGLPGAQVQCLLESQDGTLWIGGDKGLARYRDGKITRCTQSQGLRNNSVKALYESPQDVIRAATVTGLFSVNTAGKEDPANFGLGIVTNVLKAVTADRKGQLWLGTLDGLICLAPAGDRPSAVSPLMNYGAGQGLPDKIITMLHEDTAGQLWVGTYGGVVRFVDGELIPWSLNQRGFADLVYTIFEDHEGSLWFGGRDGLYRLNPSRLTTYTIEEGLSHNNVTSVMEDPSGAMWFGTWGGGVNRLSDGRFTAITTSNGLSYDVVLSLGKGRDDSLWVGMDFVGVLNRLGPGLTNDFSPGTNNLLKAIRVIHEDRNGMMWIGSSLGLNRFRGDVFETYTTNNGLPGDTVMAICERADGSVWVGTDGGLACWEGSPREISTTSTLPEVPVANISRDAKFKTFTVRDGLSSHAINALYEDAQGTLWIGTRNGGLNRFRDGRFTSYTTRQGLFSDEVYEILEDDFGYFWMSCRRGIFRVSRKELEAIDRGEIKLLHSTVFGRVDGMASVQCNGVSKPAGWKSRDGRLWFPTIRGVVALESNLKLNDRPPPVVIEEVRSGTNLLRGSALTNSAVSQLRVRPGRGDLEIHFTGLSLEVPEKVRFKYRLEGHDPEWKEAGLQRSAYYNNIPHGRYRFQAIACNNDGVWNNEGATLAIQMLPHYWETWWFKTAAVAACVGLFIVFYRARVDRLREIEELRIQIASDLHDDVGSRLTKVAMVTELMDRETPPTDRSKTHIGNISGTVREITRAMDEIVWTINPRNDTLDNLANYVFQYATEYFQNTEVRCRLDVPAELPDHPISTEERHNLFMAVKEAFNNVLKHSAATEVRVGLTVAANLLTITIADNGKGIPANLTGPAGDGLANMKQRLQRIRGRFAFKSAPGMGTTVTLEARGKWST
ncbi:MAG TPA: two-component regulator propeller domain-containing protein [Verrucomicrobiae bacterium]|nr:two-component regulator propeller domain-containing protein [Verrucomicrobiae bacterium]